MSSPPIRRADELWFYFSGYTKSIWRKNASGYGQDLNFAKPGTASLRAHQGVCLAKLRVDGWVSVDAARQLGALTTLPLILKGSKLHINADAANGKVQLELLDKNGDVIQGFSRADCPPLTGDSVDMAVNWKTGAALPKGPVKIRFIINNARLYSFWVE